MRPEAVSHGGAEGVLLRRGFGTRIDEQRQFLRILAPGRDQAPAHQHEPPPSLEPGDDRQRLGRGDVIAWRKVRPVVVPEQAAHLIRRGAQCQTSAHRASLKNPIIDKRDFTKMSPFWLQ